MAPVKFATFTQSGEEHEAAEHPSGASASHRTSMLSRREREVLRLIAVGNSNQQIAQTLIITPNTVKMHIKNIYNKLDVHNRVQAIVRGRALDLIER